MKARVAVKGFEKWIYLHGERHVAMFINGQLKVIQGPGGIASVLMQTGQIVGGDKLTARAAGFKQFNVISQECLRTALIEC